MSQTAKLLLDLAKDSYMPVYRNQAAFLAAMIFSGNYLL